MGGWSKMLEQWITYVSYCIGEQLQAPVCRPFWSWAVVAAIAFFALMSLVVVWKIVAHRFKLAAALRAERERARIDHDAITARSWDGDKAYSAEIGSEEVERRVREAVDQRRAANKPPSPIIIEK